MATPSISLVSVTTFVTRQAAELAKAALRIRGGNREKSPTMVVGGPSKVLGQHVRLQASDRAVPYVSRGYNA